MSDKHLLQIGDKLVISPWRSSDYIVTVSRVTPKRAYYSVGSGEDYIKREIEGSVYVSASKWHSFEIRLATQEDIERIRRQNKILRLANKIENTVFRKLSLEQLESIHGIINNNSQQHKD